MQTEYKGSKCTALLKELCSLNIGDIVFRIKYELSKKLGFAERKHAARELSAEDLLRSLDLSNPTLGAVQEAYTSRDVDLAASELVRHFKYRKSPKFFFNWRNRGLYQQVLTERFADQRRQLVEKADGVCQHEFRIFRSGCVRFGPVVNWHLDPASGKDWPPLHWSRLDIRGLNRIGDVRATWEINRHQFFFTLGRAYWFTGDEKYARKFADLARSWLEANPPEMGVNWYSNLEIAVRLIAWVWAYYYFLDSSSFDDELQFDFLRMILQSCRHIVRDFGYSLRSMRNNHVIGDAAALVFAGVMFPEFKELKQWRSRYIRILRWELENQIYDDGTDFEQAINYHRFVLYFYLLLMRVMQVNKYQLPAAFPQKIEKMIDFLMHVMKPDGTIPQIGDCDDARLLLLSNDATDSPRPALSAGAAIFRRGDFKRASGALSEETLWLCGPEGIHTFESLEESASSGLSKGYPNGGYYVMRTGWDADARYMLFKCGPHANHGHADALHIEVHCGGKDLLRDSGTYTYNGPWEWRTFFRSTRAHNTVLVDGESQSIPHRAFRWLKAAKCRTIHWITSRNFDYVEAEHDGYARYREPVIHRRAVFFAKPEYWLIVDGLLGRGKHSVELIFHSPLGEYELENGTKIYRSQEFTIIPVAPDGLDAEVCQCSDDPIQGWFSPCYGEKQPSNTLIYSLTSELPRTIATVLDPGRSVLDACIFDTEHPGSGLISLGLEGYKDTFVFNVPTLKNREIGLVHTDARVVFLREDRITGKPVRLALVDGSYVRLGNRTLLAAKASVRSIDLSVSPDGKTEIEMHPEVDLDKICRPS